MKRFVVTLVVLPALGLSACGQTMGDRALSGGGLGAGVGLLGGAMAGSPLTGALIGGALGAGIGAMTSPGQVDLGRPVWNSGGYNSGGYNSGGYNGGGY